MYLSKYIRIDLDYVIFYGIPTCEIGEKKLHYDKKNFARSEIGVAPLERDCIAENYCDSLQSGS